MKKIVSIALACTVALSAVSACASENKADAQSKGNEVQYLIEQGLLKGTENGMELNRVATNAEGLTMLYRIANKTIESTDGGHWAQGVMDQAAADGIITLNSAQTKTLFGTLQVEQDTVMLKSTDGNDYILHTDDKTVMLRNRQPSLEGIQSFSGKEVCVVVGNHMTASLPAQANALYIIDYTEQKPVYVEIAETKTEDGMLQLYSADGGYVINLDASMIVTPIKTKNIVRASELVPDDKIMVYASMMTMSIPAMINPENIVVLEQQQNVFLPDESMNVSSFLELLESILPNTDVSVDISEELLTRETMAKICFAAIRK